MYGEPRIKLLGGPNRYILVVFLTTLIPNCTRATVTNPPVNIRDGNIINWFGGENSNINTPGAMVTCPNGTFATGFQLKIQAYQGNNFYDDNTGLNGIKLYCAYPGTPGEVEKTIESSSGTKGDWRADHVCEGLMTGFHVRAVYLRDDHGRNDDNIGAISLRGICSNPDELQIEGENLKEIGSSMFRGLPLRCLERQAICGIRTFPGKPIEIELGRHTKTDKQGLQRIAMKCCDLPVESQHCVPTDGWRNVVRCDNSLNTDEDSSLVCTYSLQTGLEEGESQASENYVMSSQKKEVGISRGYENSFLAANFHAGLALSKATGQDWNKETSKTFSKETNTEATFTVPPGVASKLDQVVGQCDQYNVRPNVFRRTDMKPTKLGFDTGRDARVDDDLELTVSDYTVEAVRDRLRYQEVHQAKV